MANWTRRNFLHRCLLSGLSAFPVLSLSAKLANFRFGRGLPQASIPHLNSEPYWVDIHCHPTLKFYLLNFLMYLSHPNSKGRNKYNMQVDINNLQRGNVKGILAAHHLPERGMIELAHANRRTLPILKSLFPSLVEKVEKGDEANYQQLLYMIDEFEAHVREANKKKGGDTIFIAKSFSHFKELIESGKIAVAQTVEGFHALGRNISCDQFIERLNVLANRGICLITLSHFFPNDVSFPVEGIEPYEKGRLELTWNYNGKCDDQPLTETGRRVVVEMLKKGIIIDLTHMTPCSRKEVFAIRDEFTLQYGIVRPLVFSHVGVQKKFDDMNGVYAGFKFMGADDEEIIKIKECNGVIGVVAENYWLTGNDNHTSSTDTSNYKDGIAHIINTIQYIHSVTQSYDYVTIGSDFDGFANAPRDFRNPRYYRNLVEAMRNAGMNEEDIHAVTHRNALRVLEMGWGKAV